MKSKSGNISILVIFILLASSLLGVLSMTFVQQMMEQSRVVTSYYKAYYLSKAGIELGLTQIQHRGIGFEYILNTGDDIVRNNFFSGQKFTLSTHLSGTALLLSKKFWQTTCSSPYILSGGQSLILPLLKEVYTGSVYGTFSSNIKYQNLAGLFQDNKIRFVSDAPGEVVFGMLILSGQEISSNGIFFRTGTLSAEGLSIFREDFEAYLATIDPIIYPLESQLKNDYQRPWLIDNNFSMYLMISNRNTLPQSFCVAVDQPNSSFPGPQDVLPTDTFFLQSQASYGNQNVALDASYAQPIPGFLFNTYTEN